ncbi:hypothetical protein [Dactylosporangium sp. NPDC051541]|uniref:hypothetical protein n=1 Tax=Dactylosporangium sp. NPDC051541 TaxID=3363977 RepID=UPI00378DB423
MHPHLANGETRLQLWLRAREFAVPWPMIETSTARRVAGDWAAACAAAHVDVDLNLRRLARQRGPDIAARIRADLRHLAPDLLRWHLPRIGPDGLLRPGLTVALARYDADLHLVVRTAPAWAAAGQRLSLALWDGDVRGPHPHPRPDRHFRLDLHRHLWDARRSAELRARARPDWVAEARLLHASCVFVRAGRRRLLLDVHSGEIRAARTRDGRIPVLPYASTWPSPDVELLDAGLIDPADLHPLVAAALVPGHAAGVHTAANTDGPAASDGPMELDGLAATLDGSANRRGPAPDESAAPRASVASGVSAAPGESAASSGSAALRAPVASGVSAAPGGSAAPDESAAPDGSTAPGGSAASSGSAALRAPVASGVSAAPGGSAAPDRSTAPDGSAAPGMFSAPVWSASTGESAGRGAAATRVVACRGEVHRIGLVGGVLTALDHDPGQLRREELLTALGGAPLPCLRAIDRVHRHPESLDDVRARLDHGDAAGALAAVEALLGPNVLLRAGALREALETEVQRRIMHGLFRAGLAGRNVPERRQPRRLGKSQSHPRNAH